MGRTRAVGGEPAPAAGKAALRTRAVLDAVLGDCSPGASGDRLLTAWEAQGGGPLHEPLAWGLGLGVESPVIGPGVGRAAVVRAGRPHRRAEHPIV